MMWCGVVLRMWRVCGDGDMALLLHFGQAGDTPCVVWHVHSWLMCSCVHGVWLLRGCSYGACMNASLFGQVAYLIQNSSSESNRLKELMDSVNTAMRTLGVRWRLGCVGALSWCWQVAKCQVPVMRFPAF